MRNNLHPAAASATCMSSVRRTATALQFSHRLEHRKQELEAQLLSLREAAREDNSPTANATPLRHRTPATSHDGSVPTVHRDSWHASESARLLSRFSASLVQASESVASDCKSPPPPSSGVGTVTTPGRTSSAVLPFPELLSTLAPTLASIQGAADERVAAAEEVRSVFAKATLHLEAAEARAAALANAVGSECGRVEELRVENESEAWVIVRQLRARVAELESTSGASVVDLRQELARTLRDGAKSEEAMMQRLKTATTRASDLQKLLDVANANNRVLLEQARAAQAEKATLGELVEEKLQRQGCELQRLQAELTKERKARKQAERTAADVERRLGSDEDASSLRKKCIALTHDLESCAGVVTQKKRLAAEVKRLRLEGKRAREACRELRAKLRASGSLNAAAEGEVRHKITESSKPKWSS